MYISQLKLFNIIIIFTVLFSISACKKDIVDVPEVVFLYPNENTFYNVGDTIEISVSIKSKSNIKSVEFKLVNSDLIPVSDNFSYPIGSVNNITINYAFAINDYYMQSGDYQILCKVENENDVKRKYQSVKITAVKKKLMDIAVVCRASNKINVYSIGNNQSSKSLKFKLNGDYSASIYLPFHHRFAVSGSVEGNMTCWDYFSEDTIQNIPFSANPPFPFFSLVGAVNNYLAVGYYNGSLELYNYANYQKYAVVMEHNYFPVSIFDLNQHFMIEEKQINGAKHLISVRIDATAAQNASFMLPDKLIAAFSFEANDDIIIYNNSGQGVIAQYVYDENANNYPISSYSQAFVSATQIDTKNYLISTSTDLLWYQYQISSLTSIVSSVALRNLKYDAVTSLLYATEGQNVVVYSIPDGTLIRSINMGEEILNLHLIYNK